MVEVVALKSRETCTSNATRFRAVIIPNTILDSSLLFMPEVSLRTISKACLHTLPLGFLNQRLDVIGEGNGYTWTSLSSCAPLAQGIHPEQGKTDDMAEACGSRM